ncbi:DUF2851 family protein [Cytophaga sp. FL35]|uniref:DUF2851 family protein n=1 Tax=Cytophaga sp. FL35 TaxID=1904456 RepID=UPI0016537782|nr:DUF2851 family protein [Cytophaga sp. FL35]MBC6999570.1 DUF2851 family protein [Cytophaga sp. FL35]
MREDLLHFIWKYKKLGLDNLVTTDGEQIEIIKTGTHNHLAGPDFFNAQVKIGRQLWVGNLEVHLKSSDWYAHSHERDPNYQNVILHVVWDHDTEVFGSANIPLPTLELRHFISKTLLANYQNLFDQRNVKFINCEKSIGTVDRFHLDNWMERLYLERLRRKSKEIEKLLEMSQNDWEQVLFVLLLKSFGSKINGEAFVGLSKVVNFKTVRKLRGNILSLESVFYGALKLLESDTITDDYFLALREEYNYQKLKFNIQDEVVLKPDFFKLRPVNFPTIRLSQLAYLYHKEDRLFSTLMNLGDVSQVYEFLNVSTHPYWIDHYTFGKQSAKRMKQLSKNFMDLLIVNAIIPLKFTYLKVTGKADNDEFFSFLTKIKPEKNTIISNFENAGLSATNAWQSQSLIELYQNYCSKNECLQCQIGSLLLSGND